MLYIEKLLMMESGHVLNFTNDSFDAFFRRYEVDINNEKYKRFGLSKAKRLRAFMEIEDNTIVSKVLLGFLNHYKSYCDIESFEINEKLLKKTYLIIDRLSGIVPSSINKLDANLFLNEVFNISDSDYDLLPIEPNLIPVIKRRMVEANFAFKAGAYLSVIFLYGSVLEALLLGKAMKDAEKYSKASGAPKKEGKTKNVSEWKLSELISVSTELGILRPDVKQWSTELKNFRNYIHPNEELKSDFKLDKYTVNIATQVMNAVIASLAGKRF